MKKPPPAFSVHEPEYIPYCCNQKAKWVCHSPTLHYLYCEVCKKEVDPPTKSPVVPEDINEWLKMKLEVTSDKDV